MLIRTVLVMAGSVALGLAAPSLFAQGAKAPLTNPGATNAKSQQNQGPGQEPNTPQSPAKKAKSGPDLTGQPGVGQSKQKSQMAGQTGVQKTPKQMSGGQSGGQGGGGGWGSSQWDPKNDTKGPASSKNAASSKAAQMNK